MWRARWNRRCMYAAALALATLSTAVPALGASQHQVARGESLFQEKGCTHCHGETAAGTDKGPDLSGVGRRLKRSAMEHQIVDGGDQMPAFGNVLQPDEVQRLVDFLRTQKKKSGKAH
ncbi:MAG: cytochrome c [Acidobacteriota bacterium]|nr:cytochrome c [Acidobacteriota bacterium]